MSSIAAEDLSPEMRKKRLEQEKAERARGEQKERTAVLTLEELTMETVKLHSEEVFKLKFVRSIADALQIPKHRVKETLLDTSPSTASATSRSVPTVAELHVQHCQSLARASGGSESMREANWKWAGNRACKLADTMKAEDANGCIAGAHLGWQSDLARCAAAFAAAKQRDFRVLFLLAEEAIGKASSFEVAEALQMLEAYAALNVRNEHLFEALTKRLLTEEQPMTEEVLQRVLLAHRSLKLMELSTYAALEDLQS
eukprot:s292_g43.t3